MPDNNKRNDCESSLVLSHRASFGLQGHRTIAYGNMAVFVTFSAAELAQVYRFAHSNN